MCVGEGIFLSWQVEISGNKSRGDPRLTVGLSAPSIPLLAPTPAPEQVTGLLGGEA